MHTGCTPEDPLYIRCASGVPPVYSARRAGESGGSVRNEPEVCGFAKGLRPGASPCFHLGRQGELTAPPSTAQSSGRFIVFLPSPYQSVLGVNDLPDSMETTLGQNPRGGVRLRQRVGADGANLLMAQSVAHQCCCGFRRVTFALMLGRHAVSNLHHSIRRGRSLEPASADDSAAALMHQRKAMNPGIAKTRSVQQRQPGRRHLRSFVGRHLLDAGADILTRLRHQPQILCFDRPRAHTVVERP